MVDSIPFNVIAPSTLVPGFFFEVHPATATGLQQFQTLLIGQVLDTGTLAGITATTSAVSASGSNVLHFTTGVGQVEIGMAITDVTDPTAIPAGAVVTARTTTTVNFTPAISDPTGVAIGDSIRFTPSPGPVLITSKNQAQSLFGEGSMLSAMVIAYRDIDPLGTLYCLPIHDTPTATAATGLLQITGTVQQNGTIPLYITGQYIPINVTTAMTLTDVAVACVNAINSTPNIPVVASGSVFPVTLTAKNKGATGDKYDIRIAYYGPINGEEMPKGLNFSRGSMSGGTGAPDLTVPLAALGSVPFDVIAGPYVDAGSLTAISEFLNDQAGRWSPLQGLFGHYFTANNDTVGHLTTLAMGQNDQHISIVSNYLSPTRDSMASAMIAANASVSLRADPGVPLNTLELVGALAPSPKDQPTIADRQALLADGVGSLRVAPGNRYVIDRIVTTYTQDSYGYADTSFQNCEVMFVISYSAKYFGSILSSRFARVKLAHDGARVPVGANIVTPSIVRGTCIAAYGDLCDQGIMDGGSFDQFSHDLIVQINATNHNMLDIMLPVTPIHQLETTRIALQLVL